jgi:hypothetical protein
VQGFLAVVLAPHTTVCLSRSQKGEIIVSEGAGRWEIVAILVVLGAVVVFGALGAYFVIGVAMSRREAQRFLCCSFVAVFRQSAPAGPIGPKGGPPMTGRGPPPMAPARGPPVPAVRM